jgi:regulator of nucleoside diphosphate kinase
MKNQDLETTTSPIILTTGIYDLLKEHIRKKKLNKSNESRLEKELRNAKQVLCRDLPIDIVTVNTEVLVKDLQSGEEIKQKFVGPHKARRKNGTTSILSEIGVATLGYQENAIIQWDLAEGIRSLQILKVTKLAI